MFGLINQVPLCLLHFNFWKFDITQLSHFGGHFCGFFYLCFPFSSIFYGAISTEHILNIWVQGIGTKQRF